MILAIIGAALLLAATYVFDIRPWLDDREVTREMAL